MKILLSLMLFLSATICQGRVVDYFGRLSVNGANIENEHGEAIQLTGIGSHGMQWFPQFYSKDALRYLVDEWGVTVVRPAMYTEEGGYIQNKSVKYKVFDVIDAAIELGVYVIVDWHILRDGNPLQHLNEAKEFFREVSGRYPNNQNIIYEICNEPNGWWVSWGGHIKPYANQVIPVIREESPDSIIIVGTPAWSSNILSVENDPLNFDNITYALHFYGNHDGDGQRRNVLRLHQKGLSIFVSEWGTSSTSGDGGPYVEQSKKWINFMKEHKISWVNWNFSNHRESSAALQPWSSADPSTWTDNNLKAGAKIVKAGITRYEFKGE